MTISNSDRTAGPFIGNGVTAAYPFSFKVFSRSDLLVARTDASGNETILTLDADYSVTLNSNQGTTPGGTVTLSSPLAVGFTLAMTSNIALVQSLDLTNNGGFYPDQINGSLDRIVVMIQQVAAKVGGTLNVGGAAVAQLAGRLMTSAGSYFVGFISAGNGAVQRSVQDKLRERVCPLDFGAKGDGLNDDTGFVQLALNSGAKRVSGLGLSFRVKTLTLPAGVTFDGEGGSLLSTGSNAQDVVVTGGAGATLTNWVIRSDTPGVRKGRYGFNVVHPNTRASNLYFKDISFTGLFNASTGTDGFNITAENCGWDAISNYTGSARGTFTKVMGIACGRSVVSTDPGAKQIMVDGAFALNNGLDEIADQHKDCFHFEYAQDCTFRNLTIWYTSDYAQGNISQTWALMRWNASKNCVMENVDVKLESTAKGRLILAQIDTGNGANGPDSNVLCAAQNINVDATAISGYLLKFLSYDGAARFKLLDGNWRGNLRIESGTAGGNAFQSVKRLEIEGPGTGTAFFSQYTTESWDISEIKLRGYSAAFTLNGFQNSSIANCDLDGVSMAFELTNSNAAASYQPNGGAITNNILRMQGGTVLRTNNQQTRSLIFAHNVIDGSPALGLDTSGGTAGATIAIVKAISNIVGGTLTTIQSGTNSAGALNANMNNLSQ